MYRHVVLIGNGPVSGPLPEEVVNNSFVVRFNVPRRHPPEFGSKCDALCVTNHGSPGRRIAWFRSLLNNRYITPETEIWFPRPRFRSSLTCMFNHPNRQVRWTLDHAHHIIRRNQLHLNQAVLFSKATWIKAFETLGLDSAQMAVSPSSGFLALVYILDRFPSEVYDTHLSGFTFQGSPAHPWASEASAVNRLLTNGRVRLWEKASSAVQGVCPDGAQSPRPTEVLPRNPAKGLGSAA